MSNRSLFWLTPDRFDAKQDKSSWLEMVRGLQSLGWDAEVVCSHSGGVQPDDYDGAIRYVWSIDLPLLFRVTTLISSLWLLLTRSRRGDVIVINEDSLWLLPIIKLMPQRYVHLDIRTLQLDTPGLKWAVSRRLFWAIPMRLLSWAVSSHSYITERLRDAVVEEFGVIDRHYCVWPSAVNPALFEPSVETKAPDRPVLFYHGSLHPARGINTVVEALAIEPKPDIEFRIIGAGISREGLEALVERLGLSDTVSFRGFVPYEEVCAEIQQATLCVCPLPDRPEWNVSSPLKIFEYSACAKPMVLTPIPAHRDVFSEGEDNAIVWADGDDAGALRAAIDRAFAGIDALTQAAADLPDWIEGRYDWLSQARVLDRYLRDNLPPAG